MHVCVCVCVCARALVIGLVCACVGALGLGLGRVWARARVCMQVKPDEMYRDDVFYRVPEDFYTAKKKDDDDEDVFV